MSDEFLDAAIEAERCLLACGWIDAISLSESANTYGLCKASFVLDEHKRQLGYLCGCVDLERGWSMSEYIDIVVSEGVYHCELEALDAWDEVMFCGHDQRLLGLYAETVADNHRRMKEAKDHLLAAARLTGCEPLVPIGDNCVASLNGHVLVISDRDRLSIEESKRLCRELRAKSRRMILKPKSGWEPEADELLGMDGASRRF